MNGKNTMNSNDLASVSSAYLTSLITNWQNCEVAFHQIQHSIENHPYEKYFHIFFVDESEKYFERKKEKEIDDWENITLLFYHLIKMLSTLKESNPINELSSIDFPNRIKERISNKLNK